MEPMLPLSPALAAETLLPRAGAGARPEGNDPRAVEQVALGFESMFLTLLIKQMRQTLDGESLLGSDPGDVLGGLFDQTLGQHLGQHGSLGIAAMMRQSLTRGAAT